MSRTVPLLVALPALALAACSASTSTGTPTPSTSNATINPSQTAVPTTTDPCQVVTASEASSLAGTSYSAGKEETTSGNDKICVYGSATTNVFEVNLAIASDAATAQADWTAEEAKVQSHLQQNVPPGVQFNINLVDTSVQGADKAATASGNTTIAGHTFNVAGIYLLKGADFLAFSDLNVGGAAPATSALETQAQTSLGRLP